MEHMNIFTRRNFLKASGVTGLTLGLNAFAPDLVYRQALAGVGNEDTKLLFVFQRGGNDGVNTCIPHGDPEYNASNRPSLYISEDDSLDLGNNFAALHPMLAPMMEIYNSSSLNGVDGPGNLAILHRIGYSGQTQSHFDGQAYWENATPGNPDFDEGMFYREVIRRLNPSVNRLAGASISGGQIVALKGDQALPTIRDPSNFNFSGSEARVNKFLGELPSTPEGANGKGLLGLYGGPRDFPGKENREAVFGTGLALADAINIVQAAVAQGPYVPENGAVYPGGRFGDKLETAAMLFKRTSARICGINIGGWDTHTNQGSIYGSHGNLLTNVAQAFQALYRDFQDDWENLIVVTMTEFGRTSRENGSFGTDHAYATVMFVGGGKVNGGVYNCDASTWSAGDLFSQSGRYVRRLTDYRAVFAEIFEKHFGNTQADTNFVIPTYQSASAARPNDFVPLNFMNA